MEGKWWENGGKMRGMDGKLKKTKGKWWVNGEESGTMMILGWFEER
jgi:hypothetical protein